MITRSVRTRCRPVALLRRHGRARAGLAAAAGCTTIQPAEPPARSACRRAAGGTDEAAPDGCLGRTLPRQSGRCRRGDQLCAGAARDRPARRRPWRCWSRRDPQSEAHGVLGAYGRALADNGNYKQALDVLDRAHTPDQPDWRILSVQGAVLDQMGRHEEAQRYYATALRHRARRAIGAVQSRPVLRALQGSVRGGDDAAARGRTAARRAARAAEPRSGGRPAGPLRRGRSDRARPICRPTKPPPTSPICGRCWRSRTAGSSPRLPSSHWSGLREAERSNQPPPFRLRAPVRQQPFRTRQSTRPAMPCEAAMSLPFTAPSSLGSSAIRRRSPASPLPPRYRPSRTRVCICLPRVTSTGQLPPMRRPLRRRIADFTSETSRHG